MDASRGPGCARSQPGSLLPQELYPWHTSPSPLSERCFQTSSQSFQSSFNIVWGAFWPPLPPNGDSEKWGDRQESLDQVFQSLSGPFPISPSPSAVIMGPSTLQFCQYMGGRWRFRCLLPRYTCSRASNNPPGTASPEEGRGTQCPSPIRCYME